MQTHTLTYIHTHMQTHTHTHKLLHKLETEKFSGKSLSRTMTMMMSVDLEHSFVHVFITLREHDHRGRLTSKKGEGKREKKTVNEHQEKDDGRFHKQSTVSLVSSDYINSNGLCPPFSILTIYNNCFTCLRAGNSGHLTSI